MIICEVTVPAQQSTKSFNMGLIVITLPCNIQQAKNVKEFKMLLQTKLNNKTKQGLKRVKTQMSCS
jgi:hypothetical protein